MRKTLAVCVASIGLLLSAGSVVAHHAFTAEFDAAKPMKVTGTVTKFEWTNPHTWFYLDIKEDDCTMANGGFQRKSPNQLLRNGGPRTPVKVGHVRSVEPARA